MTLETFFEKFDQFADAPDAVAKMRELMLQLAVQGKLVEGRENDGNAAKIFTDGRPPEAPSRYEVAENWIWIRFAAVGEQRLGKMLDQKGNRGDLKPYLRNTNVQWMRFQLDDIKELRLESEELEEFRLVPGDLLICEGGEPGRCAIWRDPDREMYFQKAIHRVRPRKGILSEYLAICLQVDAQNGVLAKHFTGATIKHFTGRSLSEYTIPLPPLAEQKRIVAKVDELMALCDRLALQQQERETRHAALARASLARFADAPTPANLNLIFHSSYSIPPADLRKSILTLAVQGKLVPQDPNDEPADELLARIAQKRTGLLKAAYPNRDEASTQLRKQEAQALPDGLEPLALGWSWATLIQASLLVVDCHNKTAPYVQSGVRLLRTTNIRDGRLNLTEPKFVEDATYERWSARCKPEPGDVLITREAPMGEVCIIPEGMKVCLGQRMMLIRLVPGTMDQKYLLYSLLAPDLMERVQDKPVGATVQHLRVGGVETLLTPIPPLAEQRRIVAQVEQLMAFVDALETQLAASRATAANLLSALVAELTGTPNNGKVSVPSTATTGRRGRPRKSV
ncbi:MAG: restriction endonuclease subunit S [Verrucomicrobia bacterium]|nr:restriction endonuclease subunit S [Verrucomicrobiota bacterium]